MILGLSLAFCLGEISPLSAGSNSGAVRCGISVIAALLIFSRLKKTVYASGESLNVISGFFAALAPVITGISLAGGASGTATAEAVNMNLTLAVLGKLNSDVLIPLVYMSFAFALVSALGNGAGGLCRGVRSVFNWVLGIVSFVLISSVSMQSFLASAADGAVIRTAKYAISGAVPIVGSTVSGALSTLAGSLKEAATVIGVGSVAFIIVTSASPLIIMLLYRLALNVATSLSEFVGASSGAGFFSAFRSAIDTLISVYVLSALIYVFEIIIFIKCGVSVLG